jgi:alpha-L-fucosidase 2
MKESAEFYLDFLVEDPRTGKLVSGPVNSPENTFITSDGQRASCAWDRQWISRLSGPVHERPEAAQVLGIDDAFVARVRSARATGWPADRPDGRLLEWSRSSRKPSQATGTRRTCSPRTGAADHDDRTPELDGGTQVAGSTGFPMGGHTGWSRARIINFYPPA